MFVGYNLKHSLYDEPQSSASKLDSILKIDNRLRSDEKGKSKQS